MPAGGRDVGLPLRFQDRPQPHVRLPPHVVGEGPDVPGVVDQLQDAGDDVVQVGLDVSGEGQDKELL